MATQLKQKYVDKKEEGLPEGIINTYQRPIPSKRDNGTITNINILAVLYRDNFGQLTVFIGNSDDPEWVRKQGQKLSYDEALAYYPHLNKENYRR